MFAKFIPVREVINATFTICSDTPGALAWWPAAAAPNPGDPVDLAVDPVDAPVVALDRDDLCELPQPDAIKATTPAATTSEPPLRRTFLASTVISSSSATKALRLYHSTANPGSGGQLCATIRAKPCGSDR
jgi:hypothetical protein